MPRLEAELSDFNVEGSVSAALKVGIMTDSLTGSVCRGFKGPVLGVIWCSPGNKVFFVFFEPMLTLV